jgi:glycosyltransferase involved in cell wall biosynthesis
VVFTFIGKGQTEIIKKMCKDLGVDKNSRILGEVSENEKIKELKSSHIFLLPSYAEGLPISILESMASGLTIISSKVGAIPEVITEGINGYLIDAGDYKTLADRILLLIENENLRNTMSKNNVKKIEEQYDIYVVTDSVRNIYKSIVS